MTNAFSDLLDRERQDARPALPPNGIPRQRLPRVVRFAINACVVPMVVLEQWMRGATQLLLRPQARRIGSCRQTGKCCRFIVARTSPFENRIPFLRRLTRWWAEEVNGFFVRDVEFQMEEGDDVRVYSCRHLTAEGACASHWSRPAVCRGWPTREWFGAPAVFKGCGYRFIDRDGTDVTKERGSLPVIQ